MVQVAAYLARQMMEMIEQRSRLVERSIEANMVGCAHDGNVPRFVVNQTAGPQQFGRDFGFIFLAEAIGGWLLARWLGVIVLLAYGILKDEVANLTWKSRE